MTPNQCAEFLAKYNRWRRADADDEDSGKVEMPHPRELGLAIDRAVELIKQPLDIEALAEKVRLLELAEEGAKEAFGTIVEQKHAAEARLKTMQATITSQQSVICDMRERLDGLLVAAKSVVERWHTPLWKDANPTAELISQLEAAIKRGYTP